MLVREVMNSKLEIVGPESSALEAARKMRDGDIGALPVMDNDNVVGVITDRDLAIRVVAEGLEPGQVSVEDVMTPDVLSVNAEDDLEVATELMAERQVRRVLVMDGKKTRRHFECWRSGVGR